MGDAVSGPIRLTFNPQLRVEFQGATVTSDAGPRRGAPAAEVAGMTVDVVERGDELADGHRPLAGRRDRGGNPVHTGEPGKDV